MRMDGDFAVENPLVSGSALPVTWISRHAFLIHAMRYMELEMIGGSASMEPRF